MEWPNFLQRRRWTVEVRCKKPINRRDVEPGATTIHRIRVADAFDNALPLGQALTKGREVAEEHGSNRIGGQFRHEPQEVGVLWSAQCRWCDSYVTGWNQDGMADAIIDHVKLPWHQEAAEAERIASEIADLIH